jgi:putative hemolysin
MSDGLLPFPWLDIALILALIAINGLLSMSELAIVSSREARLKALAKGGSRGARCALDLGIEPGRFLSTVQIGITLVGILAGVVSGAALGGRLTGLLEGAGMAPRWAEPLGYVLVIAAITYLSVVVGELVPKNLALRNPEAIACYVAPLMTVVSRIAAPAVWLLDASTRLIFRAFGQRTGSDNAVTEEEIRTVMAEAETAGVLEVDERKMISGVLRLGDRAVRSVMTPRTEVEWIDLDDDEIRLRQRLAATTHSRLPVGEGSPDNMLGVIQVREVLAPLLDGSSIIDIRKHMRAAPVVPDTLDALDALTVLREAEIPMALVHDEYGHFEGLATPADILDAIAGAFRSDEGATEPEATLREDGSWLLAGWMPVDEMADMLGMTLPERRSYETVAGLVIGELQHLPATGEVVETLGWRFEVVDLDGRRVDKVLAKRLEAAAG